MPFQKLAQPGKFGFKVLVAAGRHIALAAAFFITPVRRNTKLRNAVHLKSTDLNFQRLPVMVQHGGMQRLVHIGFRHGNVVLYAPRNRAPQAVHNAQRAIAVRNGINQHADGKQIVNFAELFMVALHFFVNAVKILRAALNFALNVLLVQMLFNFRHCLVNHGFPFAALYFNLFHKVVINFRLHITEGQILKLPLNGVNAEAVCQRRVNFHCFARDGLLLMHRHILHGTHVVQAVGQLNHNNAYVLGHGQKHFAVVFNLLVLFADVFDFAELGNAVNKVRHLHAEHFLQLVKRGFGIFNNVMQKSCGKRGFVHLQLCQYRGHAQRMNNIRLARFTALIGMGFGSYVIGLMYKCHLVIIKIFFYHFEEFFDANYMCFRHITTSLPNQFPCPPAITCGEASILARYCL